MNKTLREQQLDIVQMIKYLDEILKEKDIPYFLLGGSALGAVRHKGFIPWDDDMDIGIHRKDFNQIEQILSELPAPFLYEPVEKHIIPDAPMGHLRIRKVESDPLDTCPTIDVFALDGVPASQKLQKKQKFWALVYHLCIYRHPAQNRGKLKYLFTKAIITLFPNAFLNYLQRKAFRYITQWDSYNSPLTGNLFGFWEQKETVPSEYFHKPVLVEFEGLSLPAANHIHEYLTSLYGDYMQLPPLEKRQPKHQDFEYHYEEQ